MTAPKIVYRNLAELVRFIGQLSSHAAVFVFAFLSPRAKAAATVVALRGQLADRVDRMEQKQEPKPRFTSAFRVL